MKVINRSISKYQQGTVLVTSLLFLLIMTILGVSAMNTNVLEEKMVGNLRQQQIAFQAADSCNSHILTDSSNFTLDESGVWEDVTSWLVDGVTVNSTTQDVGADAAGNKASYTSSRRFRMYTSPPRSSGYSVVKFQAPHNEYTCNGAGASSAKVILRQGVYQITPLI